MTQVERKQDRVEFDAAIEKSKREVKTHTSGLPDAAFPQQPQPEPVTNDEREQWYAQVDEENHCTKVVEQNTHVYQDNGQKVCHSDALFKLLLAERAAVRAEAKEEIARLKSLLSGIEQIIAEQRNGNSK